MGKVKIEMFGASSISPSFGIDGTSVEIEYEDNLSVYCNGELVFEENQKTCPKCGQPIKVEVGGR